MIRTTRAGRARPQGGGWDLAIWYLMRLTGLGLFVTAIGHFLIVHVVSDPSEQTAQWILDQRWASLAWRTVDWLMLSFVIFHAFMGMRTVVQDYSRGTLRMAFTMLLYLGAFILFALGTIAVASLPMPVP